MRERDHLIRPNGGVVFSVQNTNENTHNAATLRLLKEVDSNITRQPLG